MQKLVEVAFPLPLDSTYIYEVPEPVDNLEIGQRVLAPLGSRRMTGYVVGMVDKKPVMETKPIEAVLDELPILTAEILLLAKEMSRMYSLSLGEVIQNILPPGLIRQTKREIVLGANTALFPDERSGELINRVRKAKRLDFVTWVKKNPKDLSLLRKLVKEGCIKVQTVLRAERARVKRKKDPFTDETFMVAPRVPLNREQKHAISEISRAIMDQAPQKFLLHGVTGSGKTEVYLKATEESLNLGRTVLALVPEIALTPQFVGRFRARFGDRIAVLHSARSESDRFTDWIRIRNGEASIVIGARSAVFAPLQNIGLIILDEEHDSSYKQHEGLLYHAKELVQLRASNEKAVLVLGSATPSLESFYESMKKEMVYLPLPYRATGQSMPHIEIVDLRQSDLAKGETLFSSRLLEAIQETIFRKEQVVLFLNRRGFSPSVLCPSCGECLRCSECTITMAYHQKERTLLCHYCGKKERTDVSCQKCGQPKLIFLGAGTEKIEEVLQFHFPDAKIERMDRDRVQRRGEHERILRNLSEGKADILIGTQMVTKGLDFPNVTLVGVLLADQSLHFPNYQSAERTFQLLTQVSGRAGRANKKGIAILQTFQPEHYAILAAKDQDYEKFVEQELIIRKEAEFPPFQSLWMVELLHADREQARKSALWLKSQAKVIEKKAGWSVLGPTPALIERVDGKNRFQLVLKSKDREKLATYTQWLIGQAKKALKEHKVELKLDLYY